MRLAELGTTRTMRSMLTTRQCARGILQAKAPQDRDTERIQGLARILLPSSRQLQGGVAWAATGSPAQPNSGDSRPNKSIFNHITRTQVFARYLDNCKMNCAGQIMMLVLCRALFRALWHLVCQLSVTVAGTTTGAGRGQLQGYYPLQLSNAAHLDHSFLSLDFESSLQWGAGNPTCTIPLDSTTPSILSASPTQAGKHHHQVHPNPQARCWTLTATPIAMLLFHPTSSM